MSSGHKQFLFDPLEAVSASVSLLGGGPVIREIRCRTLLNQCGIDDYSFNCYVGCAHGCGYSYARFLHCLSGPEIPANPNCAN